MFTLHFFFVTPYGARAIAGTLAFHSKCIRMQIDTDEKRETGETRDEHIEVILLCEEDADEETSQEPIQSVNLNGKLETSTNEWDRKGVL